MKLSIERLQELLPGAYLDRRKKNLRAKCPWCQGDEFGISLDDNHRFGCFRKKQCGMQGNIFTLAKFLKRTDLLNIEGEVGLIQKVENKLTILQNEVLDLDLPEMSMPLGWKRVYKDEYLDSRGFIEYKRYKVGRTTIDPIFKRDYIIFAVEEQGKIKGYIARSSKSKAEIEANNKRFKETGEGREIIRYLNSDTDFAKLLFGYDEIVTGQTKTVIAVEGIFDKFNIDKLLKLHEQESVKCNCTFKCDVSPEQKYKWKSAGIETIILFYDPDVLSSIKKVGTDLSTDFNVLVAYNEAGSDPGDITMEELTAVINNLKSIHNFVTDRIEIRSFK